MDITPGLPETDNFQHRPPWRPLVVETARHVLDYAGGTLVMAMTVLLEQYRRKRIEGGIALGPYTCRLQYLDPYADTARTWLHDEAEVIDTTHLTPAQAAR